MPSPPSTTTTNNNTATEEEILGSFRAMLVTALLVLYSEVSSPEFNDELARGFLGANGRNIAHIRNRMYRRTVRVTRNSPRFDAVGAIFRDLFPSARMIADEVLRKSGNSIGFCTQDDATMMAFHAAYKMLLRTNAAGLLA